jgi:hypothetical protein
MALDMEQVIAEKSFLHNVFLLFILYSYRLGIFERQPGRAGQTPDDMNTRLCSLFWTSLWM